MRAGISSIITLLVASLNFATCALAAQDPCAGPDMNIDLEDNMPPIADTDQHRGERCTTFAAKSVLDYNIHLACQKQHPEDAKACAYTPNTMLSAEDLQANDANQSPDVRGKFVDLYSSGSDFSDVFQGAQKYGALTDSQLPLDQAMYVDSGNGTALIERLDSFCEDMSKKNAGGSCPQDEEFKQLQKLFPQLLQIAAQAKSEADFKKGIEQAYYPISESLQNERKPVLPAFNVKEFMSDDPAAFKAQIVDTLVKDHQPAAVPLCIYTIMKGANIDEPMNDKDPCGLHGMTVVGFKKSGNECMVHMRNTWGDGWPVAQKGDGTVWIKMDLMVQAVKERMAPRSLRMDSIVPRDPGAPIQNEEIRDGQSFIGETWHHLWHHGVMKRRIKGGVNLVENGNFIGENNMFVHGTLSYGNGSTFTGELLNNAPSCGYLKDSTGAIACMEGGRQVQVVTSPKACKCH